jgi:hypothetical protein
MCVKRRAQFKRFGHAREIPQTEQAPLVSAAIRYGKLIA